MVDVNECVGQLSNTEIEKLDLAGLMPIEQSLTGWNRNSGPSVLPK